MTHIHGEITKVAEVETRGYDLPNIQTTDLDHTGGLVPGLSYAGINILEGIDNGLMKTLSITVNDATTLNEFYLTETDADGTATIFSRAFFWINFKVNLNDYPISSANTYRITFGNYTAGALFFTADLSYIEIE